MELAAKSAKKAQRLVDPCTQISKNLSIGIENVMESRLPGKTTEEKSESVQNAARAFNNAALEIDLQCGSCTCVSPRSGLPRLQDLPTCFDKFAALQQSFKDASINIVDKAL